MLRQKKLKTKQKKLHRMRKKNTGIGDYAPLVEQAGFTWYADYSIIRMRAVKA